MNDGAARTTESERAVFAFLEAGIGELDLSISQEQVGTLTDLVALLSHWASRINLTGHRDPLEMAGRLILDAAGLLAAVPEISRAASLADLGTGAGFPGLPLAILNPDLQVCLVDSRKKRHHFQREVRRRLDLTNADPVLGRVEEVERRPSDIVVAQAMAEPHRALQLMAPWANGSGLLVLPASDQAAVPRYPQGWCAPALRQYIVPQVGTARRIWVLEPA